MCFDPPSVHRTAPPPNISSVVPSSISSDIASNVPERSGIGKPAILSDPRSSRNRLSSNGVVFRTLLFAVTVVAPVHTVVAPVFNRCEHGLETRATPHGTGDHGCTRMGFG